MSVEWIDDTFGIRAIPTERVIDGKHYPSTGFRVVLIVSPQRHTIDLVSLHSSRESAMKEITEVKARWARLEKDGN